MSGHVHALHSFRRVRQWSSNVLEARDNMTCDAMASVEFGNWLLESLSDK